MCAIWNVTDVTVLISVLCMWTMDWTVDWTMDWTVDWTMDWTVDWTMDWTVDWTMDWTVDWTMTARLTRPTPYLQFYRAWGSGDSEGSTTSCLTSMKRYTGLMYFANMHVHESGHFVHCNMRPFSHK